MAGHSKWAQTKHKKAVVDQRRGKLFAKLLRAIEVSARSGGGNIDANPTLADAVQRARDASVPNDTIERALRRGTGEAGGTSYENLVYEGFAPGGVAVMVEVLTDNRNRAAAEVRRIFSKHAGSLGDPGSVSWMFSRRGVVLVPRDRVSDEDLLAVVLDAGAEDLKEEGDSWEVVCPPESLNAVRRAVEEGGLVVESARISIEPATTMALDGDAAIRVLRLIDELEES
ncbi:MAG: YebC/PmpR family DNA-binding transcriptional regulator, partial [Actinomycetota bacterium]